MKYTLPFQGFNKVSASSATFRLEHENDYEYEFSVLVWRVKIFAVRVLGTENSYSQSPSYCNLKVSIECRVACFNWRWQRQLIQAKAAQWTHQKLKQFHAAYHKRGKMHACEQVCDLLNSSLVKKLWRVLSANHGGKRSPQSRSFHQHWHMARFEKFSTYLLIINTNSIT